MKTSLQLPTHFQERIMLAAGEITQKVSSQGYGNPHTRGTLALSIIEAVFLHEKREITLTDAKNKPLSDEQVERRAVKLDKNFWVRYVVYRDLRQRGYVVKTALKYGADFRVYDRGIKPGDDHSKWIVYPVSERSAFGWHEFSARNRIAHGTKKRLMLAIVDDEDDVLYYEVRWTRP